MLNKVTGASSGRNLKIKSIIMETECESLEKDEKPILLRILL